ncbi:hypothetical protein ACFL59_11025 [Planctomycetota bacterium]
MGAPLSCGSARKIAVGDTKAKVLEVLGAPADMARTSSGSRFVYGFGHSEQWEFTPEFQGA